VQLKQLQVFREVRDLINRLKSLFSDEEGAAMVEYALLTALVSAVCIGTLVLLGGKAANTFNAAVNATR
jgi:Flp pilus assembly pilin Flp